MKNYTLAAIAATYIASTTVYGYDDDDECPAYENEKACVKTFSGEVGNDEVDLYLKGRDGKALCTDEYEITMGDDNRSFVLTEADTLLGEYEDVGCKNKDNCNNWHYVTIKENPLGGYLWENRAGIKWSLNWKGESETELDVGKECPYYKLYGHTVATLDREADGWVNAI